MQLILLLLSTACAAVPMLLFLGIVWWLDRYDREPIWLLALTFLWGAIGGVAIALVFNTLLALPASFLAPSAGVADAIGAVVVAPLIEEPSKALFLLFVLWTRQLDNVTDGFVYGAAAGLGFGMTENFLYFSGVTGDPLAWVMTVVIRTLYSAVMHATASSVVGAAVGLAVLRGPLVMVPSTVVGLAVAMAIHALWNGLLTLDALVGMEGAGFGADLVLFPFELAFTFLVFQACLLLESASIRRELLEEAEAGLLPADHARRMGSWCLRVVPGWAPPGVDRARYVETATALAMRKRQARLATGRKARGSEFYRDEVERLRRQLKLILGR